MNRTSRNLSRSGPGLPESPDWALNSKPRVQKAIPGNVACATPAYPELYSTSQGIPQRASCLGDSLGGTPQSGATLGLSGSVEKKARASGSRGGLALLNLPLLSESVWASKSRGHFWHSFCLALGIS